jgi:hypothetical protein
MILYKNIKCKQLNAKNPIAKTLPILNIYIVKRLQNKIIRIQKEIDGFKETFYDPNNQELKSNIEKELDFHIRIRKRNERN